MDYVRYLVPSPRLRELQLMELLADQPEISQSLLAERVGLTPARVNAYIRIFVERGHLSAEQKPRGRVYRLTEGGEHCLAYHQVSYRAELVRLRRSARVRFCEFFRELRDQGVARVVLYGAGETGEVALDALEGGGPVTVLAVVDDDPTKQSEDFHGVRVIALDAVEGLRLDAVVVTSISFGEEIRARLSRSGVARLPVYSLASWEGAG